MGKRGPAAKPTALKVIEGVKPSRVNTAEPVAGTGADLDFRVPPGGMSARAVVVWERVVPHLQAMGLAKEVDQDMLVAYCEAVAVHQQATEELRGQPLMVPGARGGEVRNPLLVVQRDAAAQIRMLAREFGLSPSARSDLTSDRKAAPGGAARFFTA